MFSPEFDFLSLSKKSMGYILALHIIFIVCWFAGLFYIVRLFIYATEANEKPEPDRRILLDQFAIMKRRLWYGITWPSAVLTITFGITLLLQDTNHIAWLFQPWFILKLSFVGVLVLYHLQCQWFFNQQKSGIFRHSSFKLRVFNEVATVVLVVVVFIMKAPNKQSSWIYALLGTFILMAIILFAIYAYNLQRKKNQEFPKEKNGQEN
jgi:protoporphyrinogen IX oxidase